MTDELHCYRSTTPEPLVAFDDFQEAWATWRADCDRFAADHNPTPDEPREPVVTEGWGFTLQGLTALPAEWRTPDVPAGWRLISGRDWRAITPYKTAPKKGTDRPDTRPIAKALDDLDRRCPQSFRLAIPGVTWDPFDALGCWPSRIEDRLYLASKRDLAGRIDLAMWEPIRQSAYHAAKEAEKDAATAGVPA